MCTGLLRIENLSGVSAMMPRMLQTATSAEHPMPPNEHLDVLFEQLAELAGQRNAIDGRIVDIAAEIDRDELWGGTGARSIAALLAIIGPQAGRYWSHLTSDLACEAAGNHCFHVFGVYPWTRFLGRGRQNSAEQPLSVLDNCRITWGTALSRDGDDIEVSCCRLVWDGHALGLSEPSPRRLAVFDDGYSAIPDVAVGEEIAIHWGRLCGRLQPEQIHALADSTMRQLRVTNQRLAHV